MRSSIAVCHASNLRATTRAHQWRSRTVNLLISDGAQWYSRASISYSM